MMKTKSEKILDNLHTGKTVVDGCPVQYIREVQPDGTELFLGDVSVARKGWLEVTVKDPREKIKGRTWRKLFGIQASCGRSAVRHKAQLWMCNLVLYFPQTTFGPAHHGKWIMSAAVGTVINQGIFLT